MENIIKEDKEVLSTNIKKVKSKTNPNLKPNLKQTINNKNINYLILLLLIYIIKFKLNDNLKSENIYNQNKRDDNLLKHRCLTDIQDELEFNKRNSKKKSNKQNNFLKKILFTADGLKSSFKNDISIIFAYSVSIPLSILHFVFAPNLLTKIIGLIIYSLLIIFETLNTSIEATVDRIGLEYHVLSKVAKDTATIPSAIVSILIIISSCLLGYNIYINYMTWETNYLNDNKKLIEKQKKKIYYCW